MTPPSTEFIDLSTRAPTLLPMGFASSHELATRVPTSSSQLSRSSAMAVRLHSLPRPVAIDEESARWQTFLESLAARVASGETPAAQQRALLSLWETARARQPALRRPAVGFTDDGILQASWSYEDLPASTFTVDILPDGRIDWFYRDGIVTEGSDEALERELPAHALTWLADNFGVRRSAR